MHKLLAAVTVLAFADAASGGTCSGGSGDCCVANGTPGCDDDVCCSIVCELDETCCSLSWESFCVTLANLLCDVCTGGPVWGIQANGLGSTETLARYVPTAPQPVTTVGLLTGLTATQFASGLAWTPEWTLWMTAVDTADGSSELHQLDPATGGTLLEMPITGLAPPCVGCNPSAGEQATDLAYNPTTHAMSLLTVQWQPILGSFTHVRELDLATGNAVLVSPAFPGQSLGLAITSNGHVYIEDVSSDAILHFDAAYALVDSLPLGFNASFNQGMGAHWSFDNRLALASNGGRSYTFPPDLSSLTFRGIIGGARSAQLMADVTYRPDCTGIGDVPCSVGKTCNAVTGQCEPAGLPCPWDCDDGNGDVGINDFLALLAQWEQVGAPCDFDGGGVGINDFLELLANWGACP